MSTTPNIPPRYPKDKKPRLDFTELKAQIALGTLPPEYIKAQVHDPEILDKLANIQDAKVRFAVATHPNVHLATLMKLIKDPETNSNLLILLAAHPKIPTDTLRELAEHKSFLVREEAKGVLFIRSKGHINIQGD